MAERRAIDLLVYHDLTDHTSPGVRLEVGASAAAEFGDAFEGLYIAAVGPPIHDSKDVTVVLAHGNRPMPEVQALLERRPQSKQ
jgi:hypothetical protein